MKCTYLSVGFDSCSISGGGGVPLRGHISFGCLGAHCLRRVCVSRVANEKEKLKRSGFGLIQPQGELRILLWSDEKCSLFFLWKRQQSPVGCSDSQSYHPGRERPSKPNTGWAQPFNVRTVRCTACGRGQRKYVQSECGLKTSRPIRTWLCYCSRPYRTPWKGIASFPLNTEFRISDIMQVFSF